MQSSLSQLQTAIPAAQVTADAGFNGFDLASAILAANGSFLIRMSSKVRLFVERVQGEQRGCRTNGKVVVQIPSTTFCDWEKYLADLCVHTGLEFGSPVFVAKLQQELAPYELNCARKGI